MYSQIQLSINVILDLYRKHTNYERKGNNSLTMLTVCNMLLKYIGVKLSPQKSAGALSLTFLGEFKPQYFNFIRTAQTQN